MAQKSQGELRSSVPQQIWCTFHIICYIYFGSLIQDNVKASGETQVNEAVLEGHLGIAKELVSFMSSDKKFELGSDESTRIFLIKVNAVFLSLPLFLLKLFARLLMSL